MEANEFRIGNLINKGEVLAIKLEGVVTNFHYTAKPKLTHNNLYYEAVKVETIFNFNDCEPIPITADWLLLNGYKQMPSGNYLQPNSGNFIWFEKDLKCSIAGEIEVNCIKYVHQLQNLYFSLTAIELTVA